MVTCLVEDVLLKNEFVLVMGIPGRGVRSLPLLELELALVPVLVPTAPLDVVVSVTTDLLGEPLFRRGDEFLYNSRISHAGISVARPSL